MSKNVKIYPTAKYNLNKNTDLKCTLKFKKGTGIWHKENEMYKYAADLLGYKTYEVIIKLAAITGDKARFIFDKLNKYKVEIGAKVLVRRSSTEELTTTIKEIDTEFQMLKVEENKELPFAFKNVKFLEVVKIIK